MSIMKEQLDLFIPRDDSSSGRIGGDIAILYIVSSENYVKYFCKNCQQVFEHHFIDEDREIDWYKFTCQHCDATRKIQLNKLI